MGPVPDDIDVAALVARARADADAILARAEVEASALRGRSEADASAVRARALVEVQELETRARNDREHAQRLLTDAEARAAAMLDEAEEVRRGADGTIERLVATRRELELVIERLARLPHTVVDLTEAAAEATAEATAPAAAPVRPQPSAAVTTSSETVDVLDADALVDRDVLPLGAAVATVVAPTTRPVGGPGATPGEENATADEADEAEDPVARMVRSAIERAARAASEASAWPTNPADQREALRTNRGDLS